ncbi:MAG: hypothetical protein HKN50_01250 [Gammaproteobacteria bacterium]|nr:hypothetical protein [Gammaproteobacteria bacterium]
MQATVYPWNEPLWQTLTADSERSSHALLFTGGAGLGKRALALALAEHVLLQGSAQSKALFNAGSHPDFHVLMPEAEVEAESANEGDKVAPFARRYLEPHSGKARKTLTIDQVRALGGKLTTHPHISKTRVVLMYQADSMNRNAANALLKNLEEPPANTLFILVSDHLAALPKTIRSRCNLIDFRAPDQSTATQWLLGQKIMPEHEVDTHLAIANNHPLLAMQLYQSNYIDTLKTVFTGVNGLWSHRQDAVSVAKSWQGVGGRQAVDILQKLTADLLRHQLSAEPNNVFFPVQQSWVQSSSGKISQQKLLATVDELNEARRLLTTTVDELLVLESLSIKFSELPITQ